MEEEIYLPNVHSFENGNVFSGSCGLLRFVLTPDPKENTIECKLWHGLFCIEKSEVEKTETFPLDADGRAAIEQFLLDNRTPPEVTA